MLSIVRAGCSCALGVAWILSLQVPATAAPVPPDSIHVVSGPLTLNRALEFSREYDLRARSGAFRADAARARIADAGRRLNPSLTATEENFGGELNGDHREGTLALAQVFELGGDRRARRAAADAEYSLATAELGAMTRDGLNLTSDRFLDAWVLQSRVAQLRKGERLAELAVQAATERHRAGATPQTEILRAQSEGMTQAVERQRAESELAVARLELAARWGAVDATFDSLVAPDEGSAPGSPERPSRITNHPELSRAAASEALAAARLRAATAARTPDLTVSGGIRRLEEFRGTGFLAAVELPIPLWNRGRGEVAAARGDLEATRLERFATEQHLQVELAAAVERVRSTRAVYDTLRLRVRPARERLVDELLRNYRSGRSSYLDLIAEQRNLLATELALVDAQGELWRARMRLDLLVGTGPLMPKEAR